MTTTLDSTQVPTLVIGDWSSRCSACGRRAIAWDPIHQTLDLDDGANVGCGIRYAAVGMDAEAGCGDAGPAAVARTHGLPYVGRVPWPRSAS